MARVVVIEGIGTPRERALVQQACDGAVFERQHVAGAGALPRRRATLHDASIADALWRALESAIGEPADWDEDLADWSFVGVADALTLYRYERGEAFSTHRDESLVLGDGARTLLTVLLYLPSPNGLLAGGETFADGVAIAPTPWTVAAFTHATWHHAAEVMAGTKVVVRGNVVMRPR